MEEEENDYCQGCVKVFSVNVQQCIHNLIHPKDKNHHLFPPREERSPETKAVSPCFRPCREPQNVHIRLNRTIHNAGCLDIAMLSRMLQGNIIHYPVYLSIAGLFSSSISALSHTCNTNILYNITSLGFLTPGSLAGSILSLITNTVFKHSGPFY